MHDRIMRERRVFAQGTGGDAFTAHMGICMTVKEGLLVIVLCTLSLRYQAGRFNSSRGGTKVVACKRRTRRLIVAE